MTPPSPIHAVPSKLITCILPSGEGFDLATALHEAHGLCTVNLTGGRGASQRSGTFADEMDILTVTVPTDRADEIFAAIYDLSGTATTPNRFMFQIALDGCTSYRLPDLDASDATPPHRVPGPQV